MKQFNAEYLHRIYAYIRDVSTPVLFQYKISCACHFRAAAVCIEDYSISCRVRAQTGFCGPFAARTYSFLHLTDNISVGWFMKYLFYWFYSKISIESMSIWGVKHPWWNVLFCWSLTLSLYKIHCMKKVKTKPMFGIWNKSYHLYEYMKNIRYAEIFFGKLRFGYWNILFVWFIHYSVYPMKWTTPEYSVACVGMQLFRDIFFFCFL